MGLLENYGQFLREGGLIPYAAKGLDYLRRALLGDPPATSGVSDTYVPPFTGGQCTGLAYRVKVYEKFANGNDAEGETQPLQGAIGGISTKTTSGVQYYGVTFNNGAGFRPLDRVSSYREAPSITGITPTSGVDNCGDPPNPNAPPSPAQDGLAESAAPDLEGGAAPIITGTPTADDGGGQKADDANQDFNDAGALAPSDVAGAIGKLASGLANLAQLLKLLNDVLGLLKKLFDKGNKSSFSYDFGNLRYDGFVRILSEPPNLNVDPLFLDLQVTTVKVGASRLFGQKSPNYFNREPIGYIYFVSTTFGVLEVHEVRFIRTSIPIPSLAYGFFYNMGLDGVNRANATGFYLKQEVSDG